MPTNPSNGRKPRWSHGPIARPGGCRDELGKGNVGRDSERRVVCGSAGRRARIRLCARPAAAYRPFDGTDAAVAGVNEIEIELQPFGYQRMGSQSNAVAPFVVFNYGFADRWEVVLQTEMLSPITGGGEPSVAATGAFLKYVIRARRVAGAIRASASQPNSDRCCPASMPIPASDLAGPASCRSAGTGARRISTSRPISPATIRPRPFSMSSWKDRHLEGASGV